MGRVGRQWSLTVGKQAHGVNKGGIQTVFLCHQLGQVLLLLHLLGAAPAGQAGGGLRGRRLAPRLRPLPPPPPPPRPPRSAPRRCVARCSPSRPLPRRGAALAPPGAASPPHCAGGGGRAPAGLRAPRTARSYPAPPTFLFVLLFLLLPARQ